MIKGAQGKAAQVKGGVVAVWYPGQPACEQPLHARPMGGTGEVARHELGQIDLTEAFSQQIRRPHLGEGMELQMKVRDPEMTPREPVPELDPAADAGKALAPPFAGRFGSVYGVGPRILTFPPETAHYPQHFLDLRPLPLGQGGLRPTDPAVSGGFP